MRLPDLRSWTCITAARRQSQALASSARAATEQRFIDAVSAEDGARGGARREPCRAPPPVRARRARQRSSARTASGPRPRSRSRFTTDPTEAPLERSTPAPKVRNGLVPVTPEDQEAHGCPEATTREARRQARRGAGPATQPGVHGSSRARALSDASSAGRRCRQPAPGRPASRRNLAPARRGRPAGREGGGGSRELARHRSPRLRGIAPRRGLH
jgi:hypothetical protein